MDSVADDELERLFHADLQSLMQRKHGDGNGTGAPELPHWIIGVIVVVILLIIAFFVMVIYALVKERKKQWAGSYGGGNRASASFCDETDIGKDDGNIQITSFTVDDGKTIKDNQWVLAHPDVSTIQKRPAQLGCVNRTFVEDGHHEPTKAELGSVTRAFVAGDHHEPTVPLDGSAPGVFVEGSIPKAELGSVNRKFVEEGHHEPPKTDLGHEPTVPLDGGAPGVFVEGSKDLQGSKETKRNADNDSDQPPEQQVVVATTETVEVRLAGDVVEEKESKSDNSETVLSTPASQ